MDEDKAKDIDVKDFYPDEKNKGRIKEKKLSSAQEIPTY